MLHNPALGISRLGRFGLGAGLGNENEIHRLDQPLSNYDIAGIPTGGWSSNLWDCFSNLNSCLMSFFCPCIMFSQVIIRSQPPLLIAYKNAFRCFRNTTGYRIFIDVFFWLLFLGLLLIIILINFSNEIYEINIFLYSLVIIVLGFSWLLFTYLNFILRTSFKEKYVIPNELPVCKSILFFERLYDFMIAILCLPLSLSQMARHVFQYDRWEPSIPLFYIGDPHKLPPLENIMARPDRADNAGLIYDGRLHQTSSEYTGAANRIYNQHLVEAQTHVQENGVLTTQASAPYATSVPVAAVTAASNNYVIYRADGTRIN